MPLNCFFLCVWICWVFMYHLFIGTTNHAPCPISLSDWPISTGNVSFYSAVSRPILQTGCPGCFYVYPVLCPKLTLIQPTWSAYPYHLVFLIWYPYSLVFLIWYPYALTSLYGNTAHCSGYGVAMGCYGLHCHKDRYCDVTMIWPLLFHGIRVDVSETPNNALTTRMHGDYRSSIDRFFVGFNAICYEFLKNNPIYIVGRNCSFSTVPVLFNKCSGLRLAARWFCL